MVRKWERKMKELIKENPNKKMKIKIVINDIDCTYLFEPLEIFGVCNSTNIVQLRFCYKKVNYVVPLEPIVSYSGMFLNKYCFNFENGTKVFVHIMKKENEVEDNVGKN